MIALRQAALGLGVILSIVFLAAGWHPARGQATSAEEATSTKEATPAKEAPPAKAEPAAKASIAAADACARANFRVVVDVGHTTDVPGAMSSRGVPEYAFNLELAKDIKQALLDAGFSQTVLLITATAPWRGLVERAARANSMRANLFISIHHDSVPDNLLKTWDYDGQENHFNDDYPGYAIFISNENADRAGSLLFGAFLGKELESRGLHYTPHYTLALMGHRRRILVDANAGVYRYDQLIVLRETKMAAVLLEAGSIVNRQEELELGTEERRSLTSAAVAAAVADFCAGRPQPSGARAAASAR
jgi:N-acetylmuramoyl-L-alanine amidase